MFPTRPVTQEPSPDAASPEPSPEPAGTKTPSAEAKLLKRRTQRLNGAKDVEQAAHWSALTSGGTIHGESEKAGSLLAGPGNWPTFELQCSSDLVVLPSPTVRALPGRLSGLCVY